MGMGWPRKEADCESVSSAHVQAPQCHWTSLMKFKDKISS